MLTSLKRKSIHSTATQGDGDPTTAVVLGFRQGSSAAPAAAGSRRRSLETPRDGPFGRTGLETTTRVSKGRRSAVEMSSTVGESSGGARGSR
ncbi:hypothetical protein M6B38_394890 [Iris pallida]|uniref:Uncharacterized protein n=1 Tax=Iris pallida TaxID=29817 RepID=A0AAX6FXL1_IRIPA|nr:hypothetical protein M6B38_394890 [Iris pallida]